MIRSVGTWGSDAIGPHNNNGGCIMIAILEFGYLKATNEYSQYDSVKSLSRGYRCNKQGLVGTAC